MQLNLPFSPWYLAVIAVAYAAMLLAFVETPEQNADYTLWQPNTQYQDSQWSFNDVLSAYQQDSASWVLSPLGRLNYGVESSPKWFIVSCKNVCVQDDESLLGLNNTTIDSVSVWFLNSNDDVLDRAAFGDRTVSVTSTKSLSVETPQATKTVIMRVKTSGILAIEPRFYRHQQYKVVVERQSAVLGLFTGGMVLIILFLAFLTLSSYGLTAFWLALNLATILGLAISSQDIVDFGLDANVQERIFVICDATATLFMLLAVASFLDLWRSLEGPLLYLLVASVLLELSSVATSIIAPTLVTHLVSYYLDLYTLTCLVAFMGIRIIKRDKRAIWILCSLMLMLILISPTFGIRFGANIDYYLAYAFWLAGMLHYSLFLTFLMVYQVWHNYRHRSARLLTVANHIRAGAVVLQSKSAALEPVNNKLRKRLALVEAQPYHGAFRSKALFMEALATILNQSHNQQQQFAMLTLQADVDDAGNSVTERLLKVEVGRELGRRLRGTQILPAALRGQQGMTRFYMLYCVAENERIREKLARLLGVMPKFIEGFGEARAKIGLKLGVVVFSNGPEINIETLMQQSEQILQPVGLDSNVELPREVIAEP